VSGTFNELANGADDAKGEISAADNHIFKIDLQPSMAPDPIGSGLGFSGLGFPIPRRMVSR
jgi:hypothetical protein